MSSPALPLVFAAKPLTCSFWGFVITGFFGKTTTPYSTSFPPSVMFVSHTVSSFHCCLYQWFVDGLLRESNIHVSCYVGLRRWGVFCSDPFGASIPSSRTALSQAYK